MSYPKVNVSQYTRTVTGTAIRLAANANTYAAKVLLSVPSGNTSAITLGGASGTLPVSYAKGAMYELDFTSMAPARIDLYDLYVNGTNNDVVHVTYFF